MNVQRILLTLVGATVSLILAMILIWYSKRTITKTLSRHQVLHMLKLQGMSDKEIINGAKECNSALVSPKLIPAMLRKLQSERLIQKTGSNRYVITTKGLDVLKELESMNKEFQKVAKIVQKTSMISKFLVTEAIDRIGMMASANDDNFYKAYTDSSQVEMEESGIPIYGADKQ